MIGRHLWQLAAVAALAMTVSAPALAQDRDDSRTLQLSGLINDHTTQTQGAWELHGQWSMSVDDDGTAYFSAILTMERSDLYVLTQNNPNRSAHTHHIRLLAKVTPIPGGFQMSGPAEITANGSPAPLTPPLLLTVDITGGTTVTYSNITLLFGDGAASHFGPDPLSGVVRFSHDERDR